jgi:hypothetical protein
VKKLFVISALIAALLPVEIARATPPDTAKMKQNWVAIARLLKLKPAGGVYETMSCAGTDGATVSFSTTTRPDRTLAGPISVRNGSQLQIVPALTVTNYINHDDEVVLEAYKPLSAELAFGLRLELVPTVTPKLDEVATYAGFATRGTDKTAVTCSATRVGAGTLKPQPETGQNINIGCFAPGQVVGPTTLPLAAFSIANNPSKRLISDIIETRSSNDTEALPSFLVSQFTFDKQGVEIDVDDGSPSGNTIATLTARGVRVPTNQAASDPAIYGIWAGTYQRFDAGRQLKSDVTCYAY